MMEVKGFEPAVCSSQFSTGSIYLFLHSLGFSPFIPIRILYFLPEQQLEETQTLNSTLERRNHPRFLIQLPVEYRRADEPKIRLGHTVNFSESGFMVSLSDQMEVGEQLKMKTYFSSGARVISIEAIVKIIWVDPEAKEDGCYRFGVNFINISPVDLERLGAFLELYADPNRSPAELKAPAGGRLNLTKPSGSEQPRQAHVKKPSTLNPFRKLLGLGRSAIVNGKRLISL
jgi:hypothetical protein